MGTVHCSNRSHNVLKSAELCWGVIFGRSAGVGGSGDEGAWTNVETYKAKVGNDVAVLVTVARFGKKQVNQVDSAELPVVGADIAQTQDGLWLVLVVIGHDTAFRWQREVNGASN